MSRTLMLSVPLLLVLVGHPVVACGYGPPEEIGAALRQRLDGRAVEAARQAAPLRPHERLALLEGLLPSLSLLERAETVNYEWVKGTHDLRIVAGRAARRLDALLGLKLPPVTAETTQEQAVELYHQVEPVVRAYRAGIEDMSRTYASRRSVAELKKAYAGRIKPGIDNENWVRHLAAMEELLDEWCPIGKRFSDLAEIIGDAGEENGRDRGYRFENGFFGTYIRFRVEEGVIRSVYSEAGE